MGYSSDQDGAGGIATMGYTDGPGANLSPTLICLRRWVHKPL